MAERGELRGGGSDGLQRRRAPADEGTLRGGGAEESESEEETDETPSRGELRGGGSGGLQRRRPPTDEGELRDGGDEGLDTPSEGELRDGGSDGLERRQAPADEGELRDGDAEGLDAPSRAELRSHQSQFAAAPTQRDAIETDRLLREQREQLADARSQFAQDVGVRESQVVPIQRDGGVTLSVTAGGLASQREAFADEIGVQPGFIDVRETDDDGVEFVPTDDALLVATADEFDDFGPGDLETAEVDGETVVQPTGEAQQDILREQVREEHPDAGDIEFREEDGELIAEFDIEEETVDERIQSTVLGALSEPRETATTIGTAPFRLQTSVAGGIISTVQDPRGAAVSAGESVVSGLSSAGDVVVSGITDPIDTDGLGGSTSGTVAEIGRRVDEDTPGEVDPDRAGRLSGAVRGARDEPTGLVTEPISVAGSAVTDPIDTQGLGETASGTVTEIGGRIDEGTPGQIQPDIVDTFRERPEFALAAAGVATPEPATTAVGLGVLAGAGLAAGATAVREDVATDFERAEVSLPEDRRVGVRRSEIGIPEDRRIGVRSAEVGIAEDRRSGVRGAEVGIPEDRRAAIRSPEMGVPEEPIDAEFGGLPGLQTSPIGMQRQRQRERPLIEQQEEEFIITPEDLVDPDELRRREMEELREQVEQQAIFSETSAEEFDEEVDSFMTFGEPEVDVTDTAERQIGQEVEDFDVGVGVRPRPRQRVAVGVQQDQRVGTQAALDQVGMAQTTQTAMGQQMQTATQTVPAQAAGQAFEFGFGQQVGTGTRPPMQVGIPLLDATGTDRGEDFREDATAADLTDFFDPLTGEVLETEPNDSEPGFGDLPGLVGLR